MIFQRKRRYNYNDLIQKSSYSSHNILFPDLGQNLRSTSEHS